VRYIGDTFREGVIEPSFEVDIIRPEALGSADIVKIDIEGGEAEVLAAWKARAVPVPAESGKKTPTTPTR
jgi:hypothetical protein